MYSCLLPYIKTRFFVLLVLLGLLAVWSTSAYAFEGLGGYISEKVVSISAGEVVIGKSNYLGDLDITMGPRVISSSPTNISMSTPYITLHGSLDSLNGFPNASVWFEWGYDTSYGNTAGLITMTGTGSHSVNVSGVDRTSTIHYRFVGETDGVVYGEDISFNSSLTGWYRLIQVVPYIFLGIAILMVVGLIYAGLPLVYSIIIGAIVALLGIVGTTTIVEVLSRLW